MDVGSRIVRELYSASLHSTLDDWMNVCNTEEEQGWRSWQRWPAYFQISGDPAQATAFCMNLAIRREISSSRYKLWLLIITIYWRFIVVVVQLLNRVQLFVTPWTAARQASLSFTIAQSLLKLISIESVMLSNHLILDHLLLLLSSVFPTIKVFSNELALLLRWSKYWSFSFSISPSNEYSELISFRIDWLDLLAVQGTFKSLLQHHNSKASIPFKCSVFFMVQLLHLYMTTEKTIVVGYLLSHVWLFVTPWTAAHQASLSFTITQSLLKLMSIELVMPSNHLILGHLLLLLSSIFPTIKVFSNESALHVRWLKYWNFSFSISPSNEYSGLISFRIDWFDLLAVQGTLKSLLQHHSSKASILWRSAFFNSHIHVWLLEKP